MRLLSAAALISMLTMLYVRYPSVLFTSWAPVGFGEPFLGKEALIAAWAAAGFAAGMAGVARYLPLRRVAGWAAAGVVVLVSGMFALSAADLGDLTFGRFGAPDLLSAHDKPFASAGAVRLSWVLHPVQVLADVVSGTALGLLAAAAVVGRARPQPRRRSAWAKGRAEVAA